MFEFLLSIRVSFWLVGMAACLTGVLRHSPFFRKRHFYALFPFLASWRRRSGGRARSDRHISWPIGIESVAWRNIPVGSSGVIISVKCGIISCSVRCVLAFNGTHIHWGRRNWRRDGWLLWLGALCLVRSNHSHRSQHIERVGRQVEVIEAGWHNWVLTAKPMWNCGLAGVWV